MRGNKSVHLVNRFTSVEFTLNNFLKSLLCCFYSARLEFMLQDTVEWPSRVLRRVRITCTVALRVVKATEVEPSAGGITGPPCSGRINNGPQAPGWRSLESETLKCGHEFCGN
jgi:hypothetical protein